MQIVSPASGKSFTEVREDTATHVAEKVRAARQAQPAWSATPLATRLQAITKFRDLLGRDKDRLAKTLSQEMGKPVQQAHNELNAMPGRIDFFLESTRAVLEAERVQDGATREEIA